MAFVLGEERNKDVAAAFEQYNLYLDTVADRFPPSALALAKSEWWWNFNDHRCPHDGYLESVAIRESPPAESETGRTVSLKIRLLGAYEDGHIELVYPKVYGYTLALTDGNNGHRDWLYDEFRLTDANHVLHEIEWCGFTSTGHWIIEASDVLYRWTAISS